MPGKGHSPEQVLNKLQQVEVAVAGGKSVGRAVRDIGVTLKRLYFLKKLKTCCFGFFEIGIFISDSPLNKYGRNISK